MTPQSMSGQLRELEEQMGSELFAKVGRNLALALAQSNNAALTVMDVVPKSDLGKRDEQRFGASLDSLFRQHRLEELEALIEARRDDGVRIYTQIVSGTPFLELIRAVQLKGYDLLIKAPRRPEGLADRLLGSMDIHIMRKCCADVYP